MKVIGVSKRESADETLDDEGAESDEREHSEDMECSEEEEHREDPAPKTPDLKGHPHILKTLVVCYYQKFNLFFAFFLWALVMLDSQLSSSLHLMLHIRIEELVAARLHASLRMELLPLWSQGVSMVS